MEIRDEPVIKIDCKQGLIKAVRFNADGQYSLSCGSDRTIKLWRQSKLLQLKCYKGHSSDVVDCRANQDSSQLISCSLDKSVILWDVETGKILRRYRNLAPFSTICFGGPDERLALASSADGTVRIYDLKTQNAWEPIQTLSESSDGVTCCKVYKHFVFTTSIDKGLRTYDIRNGSLTVDTLHMPLNHVSISQNGGSLLVSCLRGNNFLIDRKEAKIVQEYTGSDNKLFRLESSFLLDDTCVASGSEDGKVYIWNTSSTKPHLAFNHTSVNPPIIQTLSSDSLDYLLSACGNFMFMWML